MHLLIPDLPISVEFGLDIFRHFWDLVDTRSLVVWAVNDELVVFLASWLSAFGLGNDHSFGAFSPVGVRLKSSPREATMCHELEANVNISLLLEFGDFNGNSILFSVEIGV